MTYWLALATAVPFATLACLILARRKATVGWDVLAVCWLGALFAGGLFALLGSSGVLHPMLGVAFSLAMPWLMLRYLERRSNDDLSPQEVDAAWATGCRLMVGLVGLAMVLWGLRPGAPMDGVQGELARTSFQPLLMLANLAVVVVAFITPFWRRRASGPSGSY